MNGFNPIDGGYSDIVSVNDDSLGSVESLKFTLNIDSSIYANEIYTLNYINNLFKSLQKICENCQSITNSAKNYFIRNNEISEVTPPEIIDFDFAISTETTIGIADAMQGYQTGSVSIKSGTLNFRSTPSTSGTILASLTNNTPLRIVSQSENSEWLKVQTEDGQEGYVSSKYVTISNPYSETQTSVGESKDYFTQSAQPLFSPKKEESINSVGTVDITSGTLNVRETPNGNIISSLNKGDSVTILGESESDPNWLKILTSDGQEGYVHSNYVALSSPTSTTPEESINSVGTVDITNGTLNVRETPNGNIISSLNKGDSVTILGESESDPNWLKILTSDGQEAYVYSQYIDRG